MQHRKKCLLGICGLLAVAAMTVIASLLPAASALAAEEAETAYNANTIDITVTVSGPGSAIVIPDSKSLDIVDGVLTNNILSGTTTYRNVVPDSIKHTLVCVNPQSGAEVLNTDIPQVINESAQTVTFTYDMQSTDQVGTAADCTLSATALTESGAIVPSDVLSFSYRAMYIMIKGETAQNGDPIASVKFNSNVKSILFQVYGKDGKPVFVNKDGQEEPILVNADKLNYETLLYELTLPMAKYGAKAGDYTLTAIAYDEENGQGNTVSMNTITIKYRPDLPNNPNTGSVFGDKNISKMDFLLTGLIIFGAVAGFSTYLVLRKNRR